MIKKILQKYNNLPVAAKAALWFVFCSTLQKCISVITTPIFTRMMSTEQYGQYSVYNSWLQIFTIITTFRLNYAVFSKGMSKYKEDRDGYTSTMQTVTFIITVIVFVIYLFLHKWIDKMTELPTFIMIAMFAELLVVPAIDFWTIRKRFDYLYKPVVFRTLLMAFLNASFGVGAVLLSDEKGIARILSCIGVNFCFGLILFVHNLRKGKKIFNKEYATFAVKFNAPLLPHYFSQYILDQFDRIMILKLVGMAAAGIYSVAYQSGIIIKIVTQSMSHALTPWQYEKLENNEFRELDHVLFQIFLVTAACTLIFTMLAPEIMMILAGEKYYDAIYVIPPVALGTFFLFMYTTFANVEFFYEANQFTMYISMAGAALNVILNYVGIKRFGYMAAAYTTLFCYIVFSFCHYTYMVTYIKKTLHIEQVFDTKRNIMLAAGVLVLDVLVIWTYNKFMLRYALIFIGLLIAFAKRKWLASTIKSVSK